MDLEFFVLFLGHLPGLQSTPRGRTFTEEIVCVVSAFRDRYRCPHSSDDLDSSVSLTPILNGPRLAQKLQQYSQQRRPSTTKPSKIKIPPTAGYTGHLPFLRTSPTANLGTSFPTAAVRSFEEFEQKRKMWESFMSSPVSLEKQEQMTKYDTANP